MTPVPGHGRRRPYHSPTYARCPREVLRQRQRLEHRARQQSGQAPHGPGKHELLAIAVTDSRTELAPLDAKTSALLTLATGVLAGLLTLLTSGRPLSGPAAAVLGIAGLVDTVAVAVLLWALHARLPRRGMAFVEHVQLLNGRLVKAEARHTDRLRLMSRLAVAKNRRFNRAVDLLLVDLALLVAGALIEVITR